MCLCFHTCLGPVGAVCLYKVQLELRVFTAYVVTPVRSFLATSHGRVINPHPAPMGFTRFTLFG